MKSEIHNPENKTVVRFRFSRQGPASFLAHLDMMRIFERALRRGNIQCEYTQGFNPRPVMAFALPLGVGVETIDDYADITVSGKIKITEFVTALNKALPTGIEIMGATRPVPNKVSMMAQVVFARYLLIYKDIGRMGEVILQTEHLYTKKFSKGKTKTIDVKDYIVECISNEPDSLSVLVHAGSRKNLRPDILLESLVNQDGFSEKDARSVQIVRTGTYVGLKDGEYIRPI